MTAFPYRLARLAAQPAAALAAATATLPAFAHQTGVPHPSHDYEGWVALAVVVLALAGAGLLIRRALRR